MLFHVTLVHDDAHCPGYHPELMPSWLEAMGKKDEVAKPRREGTQHPERCP